MLYACLLLLAVAGRDSLPPPLEEFVNEHVTLKGTFDAALQRAMTSGATRTDRAGLVLFLRADLLPHAALEERVLYPAVEKALGTGGESTATMVLDHKAVSRLADELASLCASGDVAAFERKAVTLGAVLGNHFAREEAVLVPALRDRLSGRELQALFAQMRPAPLM